MSTPKYKFQIKVPGTSANLGSGFDLLGLAFQIYNEFSFEFGKTSEFTRKVKGSSAPVFTDEEDLVLQSYKTYFEVFVSKQTSIPTSPIPYSVTMELGLPLKGGLGSSASAVVAGFSAARFAQGVYFPDTKPPSESEFLYQLALLEGHPDNTTPAYLGGFVFSYFAEDKLYYFKRKFPKNIHCFFLIPELEISTNHSRKCLPDTYPISDIIFNLSRMSTWWEFLDSGEPGLLKRALEDKIHTPYRMNSDFPLLPLIQEIEKSAIGVSLSGSGPAVLVYTRRKDSKRLEKKFLELTKQFSERSGIPCRLVRLSPDTTGAKISFRKIS